MGEFAVVLTLVGVSALVIAILIGFCRVMGGWSYVKSWLSGTREETAVLTKSEHYSVNGGSYVMKPETNYGFEDQSYFDSESFKTSIDNNQAFGGLDGANTDPDKQQTTSFIVPMEQKCDQQNPFNDIFQPPSSASPKRAPPIQRADSLSVRLGKGQAPRPPSQNSENADRREERSNEPISQSPMPSAMTKRSSWGRLQSQSSTDSNSDFPDFIAELESGESSKLKRAISCDSVSSDTSVILEALDNNEINTNGELDIALQYDRNTNDLIVAIIQARNLVSPDPTSATLDSYVQVFLMPDISISMQTTVHRKTVNPMYKERFQFHVEESQISNRSILCRIYCSDKYTNTQIGKTEYKMNNFDTTKTLSTTLSITEARQSLNDLGDVMFSLSYLPTAERLTIVVVKARNLLWTHHKKNADPFIKVYLLQNGKKISKKKTSVKKNDRNPIYNEAMIFSVPASRLQTIQLRVTVAEYQVDGKAPSIGHVFIGTQTTGKALSHWNQMMTSLRKPIAMWHSLRK